MRMPEQVSMPARRRFQYVRPAAVKDCLEEQVPVLVVGAGPVGLTAALDLARRGHRVVVVTRLDMLAEGSRAICFSKRTLDIYARLGIAPRMLERGVAWDLGKVYWGDRPEPVYTFSVQDVQEQRCPGFINLQQFHLEQFLLDALAALPNAQVRWLNEVVSVDPSGDGIGVEVRTPDGPYRIRADYLIACDGSRSTVRNQLGLDFTGRVFEDNFLIADVRFEQPRPAERWFWFEPPFPGHSALLHKQPDGVWRLDFQLGWNVDRTEAVKPSNVAPFVEGLIGKDVPYEFEWISVYTFQCRRMSRFLHGRVIFAGDAAHLVSPFGARGCNGGIADVENLGWKLDLVLRGAAPRSLLESYDEEMVSAADENILNSTRSTEFITPKSRASRALRDAVLELAASCEFARPFVNSGRLATAVTLPATVLCMPDVDEWGGGVAPGSVAIDAPLVDSSGETRWLLAQFHGRFALLVFGASVAVRDAIAGWAEGLVDLPRPDLVFVGGEVGLCDPQGLAGQRFDALRGAVYLVRPDHHVAARRRTFEPAWCTAALVKALGRLPRQGEVNALAG
jgi:3-(3-hydroxy-phenyl)propionate hydroxylase